MLLLVPPSAELRGGAPLPYTCEAVAYAGTGTALLLDHRPTSSPRAALLWMRARAEDAADQLHPKLQAPVRDWLKDEAEHERARALLRNGLPYTYLLPTLALHLTVKVSPAVRRARAEEFQGPQPW